MAWRGARRTYEGFLQLSFWSSPAIATDPLTWVGHRMLRFAAFPCFRLWLTRLLKVVEAAVLRAQALRLADPARSPSSRSTAWACPATVSRTNSCFGSASAGASALYKRLSPIANQSLPCCVATRRFPMGRLSK